MQTMLQQQTDQLGGQEKLLLSVVEQLSRPLLHLSQLAELSGRNQACAAFAAEWQTVQTIAKASLELTESYALSLRLQGKLTMIELEPLAVSSLLYDIAHQLEPYAKQYGVALELDTGSRTTPVIGDRAVLQAALLSLGRVFIDGGAESDQNATVRLSTHRSRYGVVAGLYSSVHELGADSLRQARALQGRARQPLQHLASGPAAGVFVADSLLGALQSRLHVARYHNLNGLATTLPQSRQLQLV